ncbi:TM2 domain-containing protein [Prevotella communis]|uniref:TM2 domain-containing protein n=1 Tax=Prevotella communis TaxID=2913614 RepID=UPI001ED9CC1B|nr:TM2 domain-containing protein [Prevotella communis]UKK69055.1 TM2 domain-containing protein [Prevotella communis]UKK71468.1 TM2 domain-containing protein [Prevotella communis]
MEKEKIDELISKYNSKLTGDGIIYAAEKLSHDNIDPTMANVIFNKVKDPFTVFLISLFIGALGIDRFFIGNIVLGICKFLYFIITAVITCGILSWVWWIVDLFLIMGATKKRNTRVVTESLEMMAQ